MRCGARLRGIAHVATHPEVTALAATRLEANALRREAPRARIVESGIALSRCETRDFSTTVISCGLAGALRDDLPTGTVVIADRVRRPNGDEVLCDRALVMQLSVAARRLGEEPVVAPLLTSDSLLRGAQRKEWAMRGYAAVDMESGLVVAPRLAVVRVILDMPKRELSGAWLRPATAMLNPLLWREAAWLALNAPRCARSAAAILAYAVGRAPA
jgi:hypothetical protein